MHRQLLIKAAAVVSTVLASAPAIAEVQVGVQEWGVESNTEIVLLPESVPTRLTFRPCVTCGDLTLEIDETARFYVGQEAVSLSDLRRYASRGSAGLDVFYDRNSRRLTRIILHVELDAEDIRVRDLESTRSESR